MILSVWKFVILLLLSTGIAGFLGGLFHLLFLELNHNLYNIMVSWHQSYSNTLHSEHVLAFVYGIEAFWIFGIPITVLHALSYSGASELRSEVKCLLKRLKLISLFSVGGAIIGYIFGSFYPNDELLFGYLNLSHAALQGEAMKAPYFMVSGNYSATVIGIIFSEFFVSGSKTYEFPRVLNFRNAK